MMSRMEVAKRVVKEGVCGFIYDTLKSSLIAIQMEALAFFLFYRIIASLMPHDSENRLSGTAMKMVILNYQTWILKKMKKHLCHGGHLGPEWNASGWKRTC